MANDRRLLLALLTSNRGTHLNVGYHNENQVSIAACVFNNDYEVRVGNKITTYSSLESVSAVLGTLGLV